MTQEQLALSVNVSQGYIAMIESDNISRKRSPRLNLLIKIANVLQVCISDLIQMRCSDCLFFEKCMKRKHLKIDDDKFYENNLIYYL
jgi:DNA-binding XRE family transcriptional regulator